MNIPRNLILSSNMSDRPIFFFAMVDEYNCDIMMFCGRTEEEARKAATKYAEDNEIWEEYDLGPDPDILNEYLDAMEYWSYTGKIDGLP